METPPFIKVHKIKFKVFLSFRGQDTCENLVSHIKIALYHEGIKTFNDTKTGSVKDITPTVLIAIRKSMFFVVIFSKNYASSLWCLDELVTIMECKRILDQDVIPVFYNVDPSDIENLTESFGEDLTKHERDYKYKEKVRAWSSALNEASSLSGLDSRDIRSNSKLMNKIVRDELKTLEDEMLNDLDEGLPPMGMGYPILDQQC